jgi:WD40 repeat protein
MMKNLISLKTISLILLTIFLFCSLHGTSHSFFGGIIDAIVDAAGAVAGGVGAAVAAAGEAVTAAAKAIGITIRAVGVIFWHTDSLNSIELFPNGGIIGVVVSNLIHLWDPSTGQTTGTLTHDAAIRSIAVTLDSDLLASASEDGTVQIWNPNTETLLNVLRGHTEKVLSVTFSPDGLLLASASEDDTVRLWDPHSATLQATLPRHQDDVLSVAFNPAGTLLISASADRTLRLWDPNTYTIITTLTEHTDRVLDITFNSDGTRFASASADGTVRVWDPNTYTFIATFDHGAPVLSIDFSPDGEVIACGSSEGSVLLWNLDMEKVIAKLGHESPVRSVAYSPDGGMLYSTSEDGNMRKWEITLEDSQKVPDSDSRTAFESSTPSGYTRVTLSKSGAVWGVPTQYTFDPTYSGDSDPGTVAYMVLAKLMGCSFADAEVERESKVFIKTESLGRLNNFASETVCGISSSRWTSLWSGVRITHIQYYDENSLPNIQEAVYNAVTGQYELTSITNATYAVVNISPASIASPAVGEQLELNLNITESEAVAGYQATVQFDDIALRYVSGANGDYLPAGAFFVDPKVEGNLVKLNAASLAGESNGDGTLATLTFEVIAVKASNVTLSDVLLSNSAGETFIPKVENAEITESTALKEDVNGDGTVDIADLILVASNLDKTGQNAADVNSDGTVDIADLLLVVSALCNSAASPSLDPQLLSMLTAADVKLWLSQAQQLNLTDATSLHGILFLQQLMATLTPKETVLLPNYPNPFNPETWIPYHLAKDADVTLHIYAVNGTLVRTLSLGHQPVGMYQNRSRAAYWDGKNALGESVASGVYFYTITAGDFNATRKMLVQK